VICMYGVCVYIICVAFWGVSFMFVICAYFGWVLVSVRIWSVCVCGVCMWFGCLFVFLSGACGLFVFCVVCVSVCDV